MLSRLHNQKIPTKPIPITNSLCSLTIMESFSTINIDEIVTPALAREGSGATVDIDDDRYVHANVLTLGLGYTLEAFLGRRLPIWHLQTPRGSGLS